MNINIDHLAFAIKFTRMYLSASYILKSTRYGLRRCYAKKGETQKEVAYGYVGKLCYITRRDDAMKYNGIEKKLLTYTISM